MKIAIQTTLIGSLLTMLASPLKAAEEVAESATQVGTNDYVLEFWSLVAIGLLLLIGVFIYLMAIRTLADSGVLVHKIKNRANQALLPFIAIPGTVVLETGNHPILSSFEFSEIIILVVVDSALLLTFLYLRRTFNQLLNIDKIIVEEDSMVIENITRVFTAAVPIEEEDSILMNHDYDGIQELDNKLPPWWVWGFYASIVFAVVYMLHFHVFQTGNSIEQDLIADREAAAIAKAEYLKDLALSVDENTATYMVSAADMARGKKIFDLKCLTCHGAAGQGLVGPNFTDDNWIYGNTMKDVFSTIKYGAKRGMIAWDTELNPVEIQQVSSYILSLHGTNPEGQIPPEGDLLPWVDPLTNIPVDAPVVDTLTSETLMIGAQH